MTRNALAAVSIALLSLGAASAAQAQTSATVVIQSGHPQYQPAAPMVVQYGPPPPPRHEVVPHPRRGMAWVPGHWEWRGHRYVWMQGHWVKARPGYYYREPRWVEHGGRWEMRPGGWDRDRDGIPNRYDRDRDGDGIPNRYERGHHDQDRDGVANRHDRDRDGDGVPNHHDRRPVLVRAGAVPQLTARARDQGRLQSRAC